MFISCPILQGCRIGNSVLIAIWICIFANLPYRLTCSSAMPSVAADLIKRFGSSNPKGRVNLLFIVIGGMIDLCSAWADYGLVGCFASIVTGGRLILCIDACSAIEMYWWICMDDRMKSTSIKAHRSIPPRGWDIIKCSQYRSSYGRLWVRGYVGVRMFLGSFLFHVSSSKAQAQRQLIEKICLPARRWMLVDVAVDCYWGEVTYEDELLEVQAYDMKNRHYRMGKSQHCRGTRRSISRPSQSQGGSIRNIDWGYCQTTAFSPMQVLQWWCSVCDHCALCWNMDCVWTIAIDHKWPEINEGSRIRLLFGISKSNNPHEGTSMECKQGFERRGV